MPTSRIRLRSAAVAARRAATAAAFLTLAACPAAPADHWVCVQSVVADGCGNLWVLDPAAPAMAAVVPGGPSSMALR